MTAGTNEKGAVKEKAEKAELMKILAEELPVLRVKLKATQVSLGTAVGLSRPTYTKAEYNKIMTWSTFVSLFMYFETQEISKQHLRALGDFTERTRKLLEYKKTNIVKINSREVDDK